jgi:hypothetical protein
MSMKKIQQTGAPPKRPPKPKCHCCKAACKAEDMYKSRSKRFSLDGRYVWCAGCIRAMYLDFAALYGGARPLALLSVCKVLDVPYIREIADALDLTDGAVVGKYLNRVGMDSRHNQKSFFEGDAARESEISAPPVITVVSAPAAHAERNFKITAEMRKLWKNPSYAEEDFAILWEHYSDLQARHCDANDQQRGYFPVLADLFLKREKAGWQENGIDEYDKLSKLYNATYSAAGFTPKENAPAKGDITLSNIVQLAESAGFIEPWAYRKQYPQRRDEVWRQELDVLNHVNKNEGLPLLKELPRYSVKADTDDIYTKDEIEKADALSPDEIEAELNDMIGGGDGDGENERPQPRY